MKPYSYNNKYFKFICPTNKEQDNCYYYYYQPINPIYLVDKWASHSRGLI